MRRIGRPDAIPSSMARLPVEHVPSGVGAYWTPPKLASVLVDWAVRHPTDRVIDPSCGDGVFLEAAANRLAFLGSHGDAGDRLVGTEIDPKSARRATARIQRAHGYRPVIQSHGFFDGLSTLEAESFDACVGNPPYVRYREFLPEAERDRAFHFLEGQGLNPSKLTNAWVPFLVAGVHLLRKGGRLALVLPAELMQVSYAGEVRELLLTKFGFVFVVAFNKLVFPGVEQEVVLIMGTKGEGTGLRLIELRDETDIPQLYKQWRPQVPVRNSREKWLQYFLNDAQREALRTGLAASSVKKLSQIAEVDVGVVTGNNDFFIVDDDEANRLEAPDHLIPVVTRTQSFEGVTFDRKDWTRGRKASLLRIRPLYPLSTQLRSYISRGVRKGVAKGFKCRVRDPWYVVPSTWIPDAFLFRQIGRFPRLVLNQTRATCTDTLHRLKFKEKGMEPGAVGAFYNSLTFAAAEMFGRSYGGGVLELMPSEAEKLPIPIVRDKGLLSEIDGLVRDGHLESAVELGDEQVLRSALGFSKSTITELRGAWEVLSSRRKGRSGR
jgi:adenine-specific DNA-methyltransferase